MKLEHNCGNLSSSEDLVGKRRQGECNVYRGILSMLSRHTCQDLSSPDAAANLLDACRHRCGAPEHLLCAWLSSRATSLMQKKPSIPAAVDLVRPRALVPPYSLDPASHSPDSTPARPFLTGSNESLSGPGIQYNKSYSRFHIPL